MADFLVTYPGLVFIGLILMLTLDTFTGDIPPAALVPFAVATVLAVILL
ncbi:MAG: hypothetical protein QF619_10270 [Candidatus Binatia bacterium]|jgi:hypothetical protein|nr:hypothetical protein [Candidatus Binatia bacterium]